MDELKIGDEVKTSIIVPLMPEFDPEWVLLAINNIKYLPIGTIFKIKLIAKKRELDWYYVEVKNTVYQGDLGWINSIALIRNEEKNEK